MASPSRSRSRSAIAHGSALEGDGETNDDGSAVVVRPTDSLAVGEMIYQSLDPLDPRKVALNMFEVYCHEMLTTKSVNRRAFLINEMRYLIRRLICRQYDYGRLYNRTIIANIASRVCGRHAYAVPEETEERDKSYRLPDCLVDFTPDRWKKVIVQFESLRESMLRNDASLIVLPSKIDVEKGRSDGGESDELIPEADEEINEELESHVDFSKGYAEMLDWMKFHACLSHLQPQLKTALQKGSIEGAESVVIPHDNIVAFESAIEEQFGEDEDNKYAEILSSLLDVNVKISRPTRYGGRHLKSFAAIQKIISAHTCDFDLGHFQRKFLQLIRRWTALVLPVPELAKLKYGSTEVGNDDNDETIATDYDDKENVCSPERSSPRAATSVRQKQSKRQKRGNDRKQSSAEDAALPDNAAGDDVESSSGDESEEDKGVREVLKRKRKAFMKNVKDPLDNCVEIAKSARTGQKVDAPEGGDNSSNEGSKAVKDSSLLSKKVKKYQLKFDSDDSSSSESEGKELSEIPTRFKSPKKVKATRTIHVSQKYPTGRKRKRFTEEEDSAIIRGVEKFAVGRWSEIKSYFAMELKDRDTVQIKDRWRTLNKN